MRLSPVQNKRIAVFRLGFNSNKSASPHNPAQRSTVQSEQYRWVTGLEDLKAQKSSAEWESIAPAQMAAVSKIGF